MGRTGHGIIGHELKRRRQNSTGKTDYKGNNINTDLIQYVTKTLVKKKVRKRVKHVDIDVNSIKPFPLAGAMAPPNPHNNTRS